MINIDKQAGAQVNAQASANLAHKLAHKKFINTLFPKLYSWRCAKMTRMMFAPIVMGINTFNEYITFCEKFMLMGIERKMEEI